MSILIKGMDMPQRCLDCPFIEWIDDCPITERDNLMVRHTDCPLIELPPHGDLIDRDKLETHHGWYNEDSERNVVQTHIQFVYANDILTAPIVVESEE